MDKTNAKPKQTWPYVRKSAKEDKWLVDARTKDGGHRKFFEKKAHAETYAQHCRAQREANGVAGFFSAELEAFGKTVHDAITYYLEHLRREARSVPTAAAVKELIEMKRKAGTTARYCQDLEWRLGRFEREHAKSQIASFNAKTLDAWLTGLGVGPVTRNTFRRDLCTLFAFCEKRGYVATNEASKTERAKDVDKPAEILTVNQASRLLEACDDEMLPVVAIGLFAGLRMAEIEKLDWSEVDFETGHIEVKAAKSKTARRRLIPILPNLATWIGHRAGSIGLVAPTGLRKRSEAVRVRAGFNAWPKNALRHSFGSYRLAAIHDAARVSLEMGNSQQMVFAHYRELVKPKDAEAFWNLRPAASE